MNNENSKPLLILDLDETLIYGTESELERPADFQVGPFHVYRRPHLDAFLAAVSEWYTLAIWSSATIDYVTGIASQIRPPDTQWLFVWGRDRCIQRTDHERFETIYLKDLKKTKPFGFGLGQILFVDDTPSKLSRNYGNAIYVAAFEGSLADDELPRLQRYLETIRTANNYRTIEKRGWRNLAEF
jgi:RNA polymerase II subunit A small phosphatase-like protein